MILSLTCFFKLLVTPVSNAAAGYLPPITSPPTDMNVPIAMFNRALIVIQEVKINLMFIKVDQAVNAKVLDAMLKLEADGSDIFAKLVPRVGSF